MKALFFVLLSLTCSAALADHVFVPGWVRTEQTLVSCSSSAGVGVSVNAEGNEVVAEIFRKVIVGNPAGIHTSYFEHVRSIPVVRSTAHGPNLLFVGESFSLGIAAQSESTPRTARGILKVVVDSGDCPVAIQERVVCSF